MVYDIDHSTANQDGEKEEEKLHPPALLVASCVKDEYRHNGDARNHPVHNGGEGSVLAVLMENEAVVLSSLSTRANGAYLHFHHEQEKGEWNYKQQRIEDFISQGCRFIVCGYWWTREVSFLRK